MKPSGSGSRNHRHGNSHPRHHNQNNPPAGDFGEDMFNALPPPRRSNKPAVANSHRELDDLNPLPAPKMRVPTMAPPQREYPNLDGTMAEPNDPFWLRRRFTRDDSFPELSEMFAAPPPSPSASASRHHAASKLSRDGDRGDNMNFRGPPQQHRDYDDQRRAPKPPGKADRQHRQVPQSQYNPHQVVPQIPPKTFNPSNQNQPTFSHKHHQPQQAQHGRTLMSHSQRSNNLDKTLPKKPTGSFFSPPASMGGFKAPPPNFKPPKPSSRFMDANSNQPPSSSMMQNFNTPVLSQLDPSPMFQQQQLQHQHPPHQTFTPQVQPPNTTFKTQRASKNRRRKGRKEQAVSKMNVVSRNMTEYSHQKQQQNPSNLPLNAVESQPRGRKPVASHGGIALPGMAQGMLPLRGSLKPTPKPLSSNSNWKAPSKGGISPVSMPPKNQGWNNVPTPTFNPPMSGGHGGFQPAQSTGQRRENSQNRFPSQQNQFPANGGSFNGGSFDEPDLGILMSSGFAKKARREDADEELPPQAPPKVPSRNMRYKKP